MLPSPAPSPFPANGTAAPEDPARSRAELEAHLLRLSQDLYEMEVCAGDVTSGREEMVPQYLAKINSAFIALSNMAPQITDTVPRTIVDHVDRYKNPHQYTKTALSRATGENQYALGRVLGLESFRRQLADSVSDAFPGVPLPDRRHVPIKVEPEANGTSDADDSAGGVGISVNGITSVAAPGGASHAAMMNGSGNGNANDMSYGHGRTNSNGNSANGNGNSHGPGAYGARAGAAAGVSAQDVDYHHHPMAPPAVVLEGGSAPARVLEPGLAGTTKAEEETLAVETETELELAAPVASGGDSLGRTAVAAVTAEPKVEIMPETETETEDAATAHATADPATAEDPGATAIPDAMVVDEVMAGGVAPAGDATGGSVDASGRPEAAVSAEDRPAAATEDPPAATAPLDGREAVVPEEGEGTAGADLDVDLDVDVDVGAKSDAP